MRISAVDKLLSCLSAKMDLTILAGLVAEERRQLLYWGLELSSDQKIPCRSIPDLTALLKERYDSLGKPFDRPALPPWLDKNF